MNQHTLMLTCTQYTTHCTIPAPEFCMLSRLDGLLKLMLNLLCIIDIQGRELFAGDFMKSIFDVGFWRDAYELISLQLGVVIDITEHCGVYQFE